MGHLTVAMIEGREAGRELSVTRTVLIGRDVTADLVIADSDVSARHASLVPTDGGLALEDHGSTNGTFVNGERLTGTQQLRAGDRIEIGAAVLEVRAPAAAPAQAPPRVPPSAEPLGPQALQATGLRQIQIPTVPVLAFVSGQRAGSELPVGAQIVVGRDLGVADVVLDTDTEVSRRHAAFSPAGSGLTLQDMASTNGTFVNGQRLAGTVALNDGDRVEIGSTVIEIRLGAERVVEASPATPAPAAGRGAAPQAPNTIEVENLVKQFAEHRAVDGIDLHVNPGEIYGFLGPNGAGKSTTVHMLTTLLPPTSGTVRIAGFDVVKDGARVRGSIGVALQEAALDPTLNSWEHMALQTALQGLPKAQRRPRAEELLERVELTYAADRRVGDYSGGMKRRLDLALALVHHPRILFLDEPTTGLDPQSRNALWEEVARLVTQEGMTVFLTTQYLEEADLMANRVGIIDHGDIVAEGTPTDLKAEIGLSTLEVLPVNRGQFAAVGAVLERFGELSSASNKGVAVRLRPGEAGLAGVIRALDVEQLPIANVELRAPTLDDVFLIKTGRSLGGAAESPESPGEGVLGKLSASGVPGVPNATGPSVLE